MPETDAEQDMECVMEMMDDVLHMDFTRNVDKVERLGRSVEWKPRQLRVMLKRLEGKKEILARAKMLKEVEKFKKMFLSPDLTFNKEAVRERQRIEMTVEVDSETGVTGACTKNGKVLKKQDRRPRNGVISVPNTTRKLETC
jgi:hypothetical protein